MMTSETTTHILPNSDHTNISSNNSHHLIHDIEMTLSGDSIENTATRSTSSMAGNETNTRSSNDENQPTNDSQKLMDDSIDPLQEITHNDNTGITGNDSNNSSNSSSILENNEFSFTKKPVMQPKNRMNSRISTIHNLPKQRDLKPINLDYDHHKLYEKYKGKGIIKFKDNENLDDDELLKYEYVDYNEKIRQPRISIQHLFNTHNITSIERERKNSTNSNNSYNTNSRKNSLITSSNDSINELNQGQALNSSQILNLNPGQQPSDHEYQPASFDLSKPTRRYSEINSNQFGNLNINAKSSKYFGNIPTNNNNNSNNFDNQSTSTLNSNYAFSTTPSPTSTGTLPSVLQQQQQQQQQQQYQHQQQQSHSHHHHHQSQHHSPTQQPKRNSDPRERVVNGITVLRQIQDPKKIPDYVPAVLRATLDDNVVSQVKKGGSVVSFSSDGSKSSHDNLEGSSNSNATTTSSNNNNNNNTNNNSTTTNLNRSSHSTTSTNSSGKDRTFSISDQEEYFMRTSPVQSRVSESSNSNSNSDNGSSNGNSANLNSGHSISSAYTTTSNGSTISFYGSVNSSSSELEPSHLHWKPNASRLQCYNCNVKFNLIKRKHHCRHCGEIFCSNCLSKRANLNLLAKFEVSSAFGKESKVCDLCFLRWLDFLNKRKELIAKGEIGVFRNNSTTSNNENEAEMRDRLGSLSGVPTDWTWSSF